MPDAENIDSIDEADGAAVPVCMECMMPVNPVDYYCANCGNASSGLTQYIPFVNIQWMVHFWVKMLRQVWSSEISIAGRIFRFFMIIWFFPLVLIAILFIKPWKKNGHGDELDKAAGE